MSEPIERLFDRAPVDWWIYVPCGYCNSPRRESCQAVDGPARGPHASRRRAGSLLHSTLWLLTHEDGKFAGDVLGEETA